MNSRPEQYQPITLGTSYDLGVGGNIRQLYASYLDKSTPGQIIVGGTTLTVTPEVVAMLKAILQAGCCRIEERANACRTVFTQCIASRNQEDFMSKFDKDTDDEFVKAIYEAVKKEWLA